MSERDPGSHGVTVRWLYPHETEVRDRLIAESMSTAFADIAPAADIHAALRGEIAFVGSWEHRRSAPAGTIAAVSGHIAQGDNAAPPGHETVGVASLGMLEPGIGEVVALYVAPGAQGSGAGEALWQAALASLAAMGCMAVEVWTFAAAAARGFYEHMGCDVLGDGNVQLGARTIPTVGYGRGLDDVEPVMLTLVSNEFSSASTPPRVPK